MPPTGKSVRVPNASSSYADSTSLRERKDHAKGKQGKQERKEQQQANRMRAKEESGAEWHKKKTETERCGRGGSEVCVCVCMPAWWPWWW